MSSPPQPPSHLLHFAHPRMCSSAPLCQALLETQRDSLTALKRTVAAKEEEMSRFLSEKEVSAEQLQAAVAPYHLC